MRDNNVFILFEEIRNMLGGMKGKLEELSKMINGQQPMGASQPDLSPVKEAVTETAKVCSEEIRGLLPRQWAAYAQVFNAILTQVGSLEKWLKEPETGQKQPPQEHIHKHCFDTKSSKVFSFVVEFGVACALSLWGNIELWLFECQFADDALEFRTWKRCSANDVFCLNKVFNIRQDERAIKWVWKQADGYDSSQKNVADSLMQERLRNVMTPQ